MFSPLLMFNTTFESVTSNYLQNAVKTRAFLQALELKMKARRYPVQEALLLL